MQVCPGEPVQFQLQGEYYGTKTWEFSTDGISWQAIVVNESIPFTLTPGQTGWYRVRFHDLVCDSIYVSNAVRLAAHAIDLGAPATVDIGGQVRDELGSPVSGAVVRGGCGTGVVDTTDHFGMYLLRNVPAYERLAYMTVEKEGYFQGSRSFVPAAGQGSSIHHAHVTLLRRNSAGTVDGTQGGSLWIENALITFPTSAFAANGAPYQGAVNVFQNLIDPTTDAGRLEMPGMLMGVAGGQTRHLTSYGMAAIELRDSIGGEVSLAPGVSATISFPVPVSLLASAPASVPLWYFDDALGYWLQEGQAQLVGDTYVGSMSHFSWWNCDFPSSFALVSGNVQDATLGAAMAGARIRISAPTAGFDFTFTDTNGDYSIAVPLFQPYTLNVEVACASGSWSVVHQETVGPFSWDATVNVAVSGSSQKLVVGTTVDCDSQPLPAGYVQVQGVPHFFTNGAFSVLACSLDSVSLRVVDITTGNVGDYLNIALLSDTTDAGELMACTPLFNWVTDIDGNTYPTVVIGAQEWMAHNLRTAHYANGDPIPNVTVGADWSQQTAGAWCHYNNDPIHDELRGKLYNWYTVTDPRNVCPSGWHVPSDLEWMDLESYLGMPDSLLFHGGISSGGSRGHLVNVGGKLKTPGTLVNGLGLWAFENETATDETGSHGIPSGYRDTGEGFSDLASYLDLWSTSMHLTAHAWMRSLHTSAAGVTRWALSLTATGSVRCVRD